MPILMLLVVVIGALIYLGTYWVEAAIDDIKKMERQPFGPITLNPINRWKYPGYYKVNSTCGNCGQAVSAEIEEGQHRTILQKEKLFCPHCKTSFQEKAPRVSSPS